MSHEVLTPMVMTHSTDEPLVNVTVPVADVGRPPGTSVTAVP